MQYLGGKTRIAKELASVIAPKGMWWDPFCGGLSMSKALSAYGPGISSDACAPLINLYLAVQAGWTPPAEVSREDYAAAKLLPDTDPLKAFVGFGCSFGGKWFGGYARNAHGQNFPRGARNSLLRDTPGLTIMEACFLAEPIRPEIETIYCDPPYEGATGYGGVKSFDHAAFWQRCIEWAHTGTRVFVSEYSCPIEACEVWSRDVVTRVQGGPCKPGRTERLFLVLP